MKISSALKSKTVWCGILAAGIAGLKLIWPESTALDEALSDKSLLASNFVLVSQGLLGLGAIVFRIYRNPKHDRRVVESVQKD